MEKETKDIFFAEVHDPEEVRRNILESLKNIVENLQRFEKFKEIKKHKIERIDKLREIVKKLNKHVADLKTSLPEAKIRAVKIRKQKIYGKKTAVRGKKEISEEETKRKPLTELQKLEYELNEIESKLSSLR